jgi:hypothetical protein
VDAMTTKVSMGLAALGLGAAFLTGCGGDSDGGSDGGSGGGGDITSQSGEEIAKTAKADMGKLESVKVAGSITTDSQEIQLDMQMSTTGECTGTIGFGGGQTELLGVDGSVWMKPDEAFWKSFAGAQADQVISAVGDNWVVIPDSEDGFAELCDLDALLEELVDSEDGTTYTKGDTQDLDGDEVIQVDSKDEDGQVSAGYVLTDSPHYLVKMERTEGDEPGSVTFSDFDADVEVEAPADDEVVDLNDL